MVARSHINDMKLTYFVVSLPIAANTLDIRDRLVGLYQKTEALTKLVAGLDPYTQQPVVLEDALGYSLRIPLEIVRSWHVCFYRLLSSLLT